MSTEPVFIGLNSVNRIINCDTANINKTVSAAARQIANIKYIEEKIGFKVLSEKLREIAEIRLENPESNLQEIVDLLPYKIGKSGVNHRLRKLDSIAENLREKE